MRKYSLFTMLLVLLFAPSIPLSAAQQSAEYWPTEAWLTSTPEEQGMSSEELAAYFSTWSHEDFQLDSLLVIRHGYVVAETYSPLYDAATPHYLFSTTKSFMSTLIGILLQDGLLESLDTPLLALFPDRTVANVDARKEALTVRHLLMMAGGMEDNEMEAAQLGVPDTYWLAIESGDMLQYILDLPMTADPGTQWYYAGIYPELLSIIITELTGKTAAEYAAEKLFAPLGITDFTWVEVEPGHSMGPAGLSLTPRDMAKLGYLYLQGGNWDGQQIIPADFAAAALAKQIATPWDGTPYGYLFWRFEPINMSFALGHSGQYILIFPDKDLLVVMTAGMTEDLRIALNGFPMFFATGGLKTADEALPADEAAYENLQNVLTAIHESVATEVPALPEMATTISNVNYYLFNTNLFHPASFAQRVQSEMDRGQSSLVQTLKLNFEDPSEAKLYLGSPAGTIWTIPVGLDGVYHVSEGPLGKVGAKGEWLDDDLFRVFVKQVETGFLYRLDINFIPHALNITSFEYSEGAAAAVLGLQMQ